MNRNYRELNECIQEKLITSSCYKEHQRVKKLIIKNCSIEFLKHFNRNSSLKCLQLQFQTIPTELVVISKWGFIIVPFNEDSTFCINPLENNYTKHLYEKYYLPTSLTLPYLNNKQNDLSMFHYIQNIKINIQDIPNNTTLTLPTTIETFELNYKNKNAIDRLKITNWNELHHISSIIDYDNLDIPYPQLLKQQSKLIKQHPPLNEIITSWLSLICAIYLLIPLTTIFITTLLTSITSNIFYKMIYKQMFVYYHMYSIFLLYIVFSSLHNKISKNNITLCCNAICHTFSSLVYIYSLSWYQSTSFFMFLTLTTIPLLLCLHLTAFYFFGQIDNYKVTKYVRILSLGSSLSNIFEFFMNFIHQFHSQLLTIFGFVLFPCGTAIGLIISFFNTTGLISWLCLLGLFSFVYLFRLLIGSLAVCLATNSIKIN
ncbi:hypothetical protein QTN25_008677 [Entamoeba marina]